MCPRLPTLYNAKKPKSCHHDGHKEEDSAKKEGVEDFEKEKQKRP
jgi:hypothetical protein